MDTSTSTPPKPPPGNSNEAVFDSMGRPLASSGAKANSQKGLGILTLVMFAAGIFLLIWGWNEIKGSHESGGWPGTQGTITSSSITKRTSRDSNRRTRTHYYPNVRYRYQVDGKQYTGTRIEFGGKSGGKRNWANEVTARYSSGKTVKVYYNPEDPGIAVLEAGLTGGAILIFLSGAIFLGVGVMCLKALRRANRKQ